MERGGKAAGEGRRARARGRRLFEQYGLQKTTVEEIAQATHISKGAFYLFYSSKEELYFAILETMEEEMRERVYASLVKEISGFLGLNGAGKTTTIRQTVSIPPVSRRSGGFSRSSLQLEG